MASSPSSSPPPRPTPVQSRSFPVMSLRNFRPLLTLPALTMQSHASAALDSPNSSARFTATGDAQPEYFPASSESTSSLSESGSVLLTPPTTESASDSDEPATLLPPPLWRVPRAHTPSPTFPHKPVTIHPPPPRAQVRTPLPRLHSSGSRPVRPLSPPLDQVYSFVQSVPISMESFGLFPPAQSADKPPATAPSAKTSKQARRAKKSKRAAEGLLGVEPEAEKVGMRESAGGGSTPVEGGLVVGP